MTGQLQPGHNDMVVRFLAQDEQAGEDVASFLADFIAGARHTLEMVYYDFRLSQPYREIVAAAMQARAAAGVAIRIAYDADKPESPNWDAGQDPAEGGTGRVVQSLGFPWQRIGGPKLMHHKYIVRDAGTPLACVWTGSTNITDQSFTLQDNNIVILSSPELAEYYQRNFEELWQTGTIGASGSFDTALINMMYQGEPARVRVLFSPGRGPSIDYEVAYQVAQASRRVRVCSMLLNSGALLSALSDHLRTGSVPVDGVYDRTQMESVLEQWQDVPHNHWKISAVRDIVAAAGLVGKNSTPYSPETPHDFMHNKILLVDDTVITGSYNFSHSATLNAENILGIESPALARQYSAYINHLKLKYAAAEE